MRHLLELPGLRFAGGDRPLIEGTRQRGPKALRVEFDAVAVDAGRRARAGLAAERTTGGCAEAATLLRDA